MALDELFPPYAAFAEELARKHSGVIEPTINPLYAELKMFKPEIQGGLDRIYLVYQFSKNDDLLALYRTIGDKGSMKRDLAGNLNELILVSRREDKEQDERATAANLRSIWVPDWGQELPLCDPKCAKKIRVVLYSVDPKSNDVLLRSEEIAGFTT